MIDVTSDSAFALSFKVILYKVVEHGRPRIIFVIVGHARSDVFDELQEHHPRVSGHAFHVWLLPERCPLFIEGKSLPHSQQLPGHQRVLLIQYRGASPFLRLQVVEAKRVKTNEIVFGGLDILDPFVDALFYIVKGTGLKTKVRKRQSVGFRTFSLAHNTNHSESINSKNFLDLIFQASKRRWGSMGPVAPRSSPKANTPFALIKSLDKDSFKEPDSPFSKRK